MTLLFRFCSIVLIQALLAMDAGGGGETFSVHSLATTLTPNITINVESFKNTFLLGLETTNPTPAIEHSPDFKTVGNASGGRSVIGGGQMFWLRGILWFAASKLTPNVFVNRRRFNARYGLMVAPWFENVFVYALSWVLGGNFVMAWGLFVAGHAVDIMLNLVRSTEERAPPVNLIYAIVIASVSIVFLLSPANPLSWGLHFIASIAATLPKTYFNNRFIRNTVLYTLVMGSVAFSIGFINDKISYFQISDRVKQISASEQDYQRNSNRLNEIKGKNISWQSKFASIRQQLKDENITEQKAVGLTKELKRLVEEIEDPAKLEFKNIQILMSFVGEPEVVSIPSFAARQRISDVKKFILASLRRVNPGDNTRVGGMMSDLYESYREEVTRPDHRFAQYFPRTSERDLLTFELKNSLALELNLFYGANLVHYELTLPDNPYFGRGDTTATDHPQRVYRKFSNTYYFDEFLKDADLLKNYNAEGVHVIPMSLLEQIREIRKIPRQVVECIQESAQAHNLSPLFVSGLLLGYGQNMEYSLWQQMILYSIRTSGSVSGMVTDLLLGSGLIPDGFVEVSDFSGLTENPQELWNVLMNESYIAHGGGAGGGLILPHNGFITEKFRTLKNAGEMRLPDTYRGKTNEIYNVLKRHSYRIYLPYAWGDLISGVVLGNGNPSVGIFAIRAPAVREYQLFKRFGIDAKKLSNREINMMLLDTKYNVEAWAGFLRAIIDEVEELRGMTAEERQKRYEVFLQATMTAFNRLPNMKIFATKKELGADDWILAMFHPIYSNKVLVMNFRNIALSGLFDNNPGIFSGVESMENLNKLRELLFDEDSFIRDAAFRTLENLVKDSSNPDIQKEAASAASLSRGNAGFLSQCPSPAVTNDQEPRDMSLPFALRATIIEKSTLRATQLIGRAI